MGHQIEVQRKEREKKQTLQRKEECVRGKDPETSKELSKTVGFSPTTVFLKGPGSGRHESKS